MNKPFSLAIIAVIAVVTLFTRALPFAVFSKSRKVPKIIDYLGKYLPYAITMMLVVYCLKEVNLFEGNHGIPEFISIIFIIVIHIWKRNVILSIASGTILYMILLNFM